MSSEDITPASNGSVPTSTAMPTTTSFEKAAHSKKFSMISAGRGKTTTNPEYHQLRTEVARLSPPVGQFIISTILNILGFAAAIAFGVFAVRSVSLAIASNNAASRANDLASMANDQSTAANQLALIALCSTANNVSEACVQIMQNAEHFIPSAATLLGFNAPGTSPSAAPSGTLPASSSPTSAASTSSGVTELPTPSSSISSSPASSSAASSTLSSGAGGATITTRTQGPSSTIPASATAAPSSSSTSPNAAATTLASSPSPTHAASAGPLAGIVVGAIIGAAALMFLTYLFCARRRRFRTVRYTDGSPEMDEESLERGRFKESMGLRFRKFFLDSTVIRDGVDSRAYDI